MKVRMLFMKVENYSSLKRRIFQLKATQDEDTRLKILTPKQMLQRLPTALAQVKAGNTFENFLNEIRQIIYSRKGNIII